LAVGLELGGLGVIGASIAINPVHYSTVYGEWHADIELAWATGLGVGGAIFGGYGRVGISCCVWVGGDGQREGTPQSWHPGLRVHRVLCVLVFGAWGVRLVLVLGILVGLIMLGLRSPWVGVPAELAFFASLRVLALRGCSALRGYARLVLCVISSAWWLSSPGSCMRGVLAAGGCGINACLVI